MFVSNMLKKCANLINHNENTKDDIPSKKKEETLRRQSFTEENENEENHVSVICTDETNINNTLSVNEDLTLELIETNEAHDSDFSSIADAIASLDINDTKEDMDQEFIDQLLCISDAKYSVTNETLVPSEISCISNEDQELKPVRDRNSLAVFDPINSPSCNKELAENNLLLLTNTKLLEQLQYESLAIQSTITDSFRDNCIFTDDIPNKTRQLDLGSEEKLSFEEPSNENIEEFVKELLNSIIETAVTIIEYQEHTPTITAIKKTMADITDKLALEEEENAELKLQLNASQQVRATLELQLRQKEEIIIKSQAEAARREQAYKQEFKQLKEKLEEKCVENDNSGTKELQETIKALKARESNLLSELNARKNDEQNYRRIMNEYEKTMATKLAEVKKLQEEHETAKQHLANLELAFSDVHLKYERSKKIIDGYKSNEDTLRQTLISSEDSVRKSEEKYESLKAHAKAQIEKSNQEMQLMRDQYMSEIHKLSAIIKRLEIKNASLADSLEQKTKECSALAALCDEVTGKV